MRSPVRVGSTQPEYMRVPCRGEHAENAGVIRL